MQFLYAVGIRLYQLFILLVSPFNRKAASWIRGRKNWRTLLSMQLKPREQRAWFHFASLGEFEQGRPVLEAFRRKNPSFTIVVTFFSPSGYEVRKDYPLADYVFYLPADTPGNARDFITAISPEIVFFTKYEFWHFYFRELGRRNIPLYIVSAIFRKEQLFFKPYGGFYRSILQNVTHFFVQDTASAALLDSIGLHNYTLTGDTRFDRVLENLQAAKPLPLIEDFAAGKPVFIAGSTWPEDEAILAPLINSKYYPFRWIIAAHEIGAAHLQQIESRLSIKHIRYSEALVKGTQDAEVLIIDNIGMLLSLYAYARIAYIGGGFGKGIHNTLEAAASGIPIFFGPRYEKFKEAKDLIALGGAKSIRHSQELRKELDFLEQHPERYTEIAAIIHQYMEQSRGATDTIMKQIAVPDQE